MCTGRLRRMFHREHRYIVEKADFDKLRPGCMKRVGIQSRWCAPNRLAGRSRGISAGMHPKPLITIEEPVYSLFHISSLYRSATPWVSERSPDGDSEIMEVYIININCPY